MSLTDGSAISELHVVSVVDVDSVVVSVVVDVSVELITDVEVVESTVDELGSVTGGWVELSQPQPLLILIMILDRAPFLSTGSSSQDELKFVVKTKKTKEIVKYLIPNIFTFSKIEWYNNAFAEFI